jgi:hypothetical protein
MIQVGTPLKGCAGSFDCQIPSRPILYPYPPPISGTSPSANIVAPGFTFGPANSAFFRYQPSSGVVGSVVRTPPTVAPYSTQHWLIRNSLMPLLGQGAVDGDGIAGIAYPSDFGWAQKGRVPRVPKTLVVMCPQPFFDINAVLDSIAPAINAAGIDMMFPENANVRFASALPITSVTWGSIFTNPLAGTRERSIGVVGTADPTDMQGGDVMYAGIGAYASGYQTAAMNVSFDTMAGTVDWFTADAANYLVTFGSALPGIANFNLSPTQLDDGYYAYTDVAHAEANILNQVALQCRRFRFDVYGDVNGVPVTGAVGKTAAEADALFRNGVPGFAFNYDSLDPVALGADLLANALAFFS